MSTPPPGDETFPVMVEDYSKNRKLMLARYRPGVCAYILAFARRHNDACKAIEASGRLVRGSPAAAQHLYHRSALSSLVDLANRLAEPVDGEAWVDGAVAAYETYLDG